MLLERATVESNVCMDKQSRLRQLKCRLDGHQYL